MTTTPRRRWRTPCRPALPAAPAAAAAAAGRRPAGRSPNRTSRCGTGNGGGRCSNAGTTGQSRCVHCWSYATNDDRPSARAAAAYCLPDTSNVLAPPMGNSSTAAICTRDGRRPRWLEEALQHDPELPAASARAGQHDEFDELATRDVVVLVRVDGKVAAATSAARRSAARRGARSADRGPWAVITRSDHASPPSRCRRTRRRACHGQSPARTSPPSHPRSPRSHAAAPSR